MHEAPSKTTITLWITEDDKVKDPQLLTKYQGWLRAGERERWQRFHFARHRHQFLVSRGLLRAVLSEYLGLAPGDLVFEQNAWGKPAIAGAEGARLHFNLSHTDGLVVLAVVGEQETRDKGQEGVLLGVDVENLDRKTQTHDLAQRYFSPQECQALAALPEKQQRRRFFDLWTLKEAYIKAVGRGLSIPLDSFSVHFGNEVGISFSPEREDDPGLWRFWQHRYGDRHQIALACKGGEQVELEIQECVPGKPTSGMVR